MSHRSTVATDSTISDAGETAFDGQTSSAPGKVHFIPTVFWTAWPVPKSAVNMIPYVPAVTGDGTARSIVRSDDVSPDQASDFASAEQLSAELNAAMMTTIEDKNKRTAESSAAEILRMVYSSDENTLGSSDTSVHFDRALGGLIESDSKHAASKHHWLDPITLYRTFPETFENFDPDYSALPSIGKGDTQPAQESSDAEPHMDDCPKARFLDDLKKISIDTPERSCVPS